MLSPGRPRKRATVHNGQHHCDLVDELDLHALLAAVEQLTGEVTDLVLHGGDLARREPWRDHPPELAVPWGIGGGDQLGALGEERVGDAVVVLRVVQEDAVRDRPHLGCPRDCPGVVVPGDGEGVEILAIERGRLTPHAGEHRIRVGHVEVGIVDPHELGQVGHGTPCDGSEDWNS